MCCGETGRNLVLVIGTHHPTVGSAQPSSCCRHRERHCEGGSLGTREHPLCRSSQEHDQPNKPLIPGGLWWPQGSLPVTCCGVLILSQLFCRVLLAGSGDGEMVQSVKGFPRKHKDPNSIQRTQAKWQGWREDRQLLGAAGWQARETSCLKIREGGREGVGRELWVKCP